MNILYLVNHLNVGGISSYLFSLGAGLKAKGHNVYLASGGGELLGKFTAAGIMHIQIPLRTKNEASPKIIISFLKLRALIRKYDIQLVHSQSRTTQVLGCLLRKYYKIAHVFTGHGFFQPKLSRRLFPCWGEAVIAVSEPVKEHFIRDFQLAGEKIAVVHNGVAVNALPVARSREDILRQLGLGSGPIIGSIGRLSDVKGHTYLIGAFPEILGKFPDAQLLLAGEGKMYDCLMRQAKQLGVKDKVFFLPQFKDMREVLSVLDVFVMPSLQEGLGLALMEAMAEGKAVVGSDIGGIKSLIQDQVNGLLVPAADPAALSQAIIGLLLDAGRRSSLGRGARDFIRNNFSLETMINQTERVYIKCLSVKGL